ncbi:unnamed protein product [Peronospora belbahrii]|uniref:HTH psq-type domain-containing protein n=1 Tax=Peronospora belbahrii TaxID=622444 RepID=A0AAU9KJX0_9STRA|nr:unnamed protein product [Peronospora belbahrii]CAH0515241.1 unnamed protein product [Peronospora belbahrii]
MEKGPFYVSSFYIKSNGPEGGVNLPHTKRAIPDNSNATVKLKRLTMEIPQPNEISTMRIKKKTRKPPNYLRHSDRCCIITRIAGGEQQAALAREFGVTRAAVCQIYKNRDEILARGDDMEPQVALVQDPKVLQTDVSLRTENALPFDKLKSMAAPHLRNLEFRSKRVMLLLAVLRDVRTSPVAFQRAAARLTFILVEEALATYDYDEIGHVVNTQRGYAGATYCAVTLGSTSVSFLTAFGQIDPNLSTGQIHVKAVNEDGFMNWQLQYLDVPDNISSFEVLLFSTSANGGAECKAIEALRRVGVSENSISLIMVVCSSHGYEGISSRYPRVTLISAAIDDKWTLHQAVCSQDVVPASYAFVTNDQNDC